MSGAPRTVGAARRGLAQALLARAADTLADAEELLEGGRLRASVILGCEVVFDAARAFLVLWGLDPGADVAGTSALFDRQVIETGLVSPGLSVTVHRAVRLAREIREGPPVAVYQARARGLLEGARQLVEETEIVLAPLLDEREPRTLDSVDDLPDTAEAERARGAP